MKEPLLFISAENPYPQDSGGKLRTGNILKLLQGKYEVEAHHLCQSPEDRDAGGTSVTYSV